MRSSGRTTDNIGGDPSTATMVLVGRNGVADWLTGRDRLRGKHSVWMCGVPQSSVHALSARRRNFS
jgi:hypothetical protein